MNCLQCARLNLTKFPNHARVGFGRCELETMPGVFMSISFEHKCTDFTAAPEDIKQKRIEWAAKRK